MKKIGVLGLQGSVSEHLSCLEKADAEPIRVKSKADLDLIDGLILPGGESTTLGILLREFEILNPLKHLIEDGLPVWGTCAGMILLAKKIVNQDEIHLGLMDISVRRNGFGSQIDSFMDTAFIPSLSQAPIPLVFIRAPIICEVWGKCEILASLNGSIVAAKQENMLATAFHPELTKDISFYRYFLNIVLSKKKC